MCVSRCYSQRIKWVYKFTNVYSAVPSILILYRLRSCNDSFRIIIDQLRFSDVCCKFCYKTTAESTKFVSVMCAVTYPRIVIASSANDDNMTTMAVYWRKSRYASCETRDVSSQLNTATRGVMYPWDGDFTLQWLGMS